MNQSPACQLFVCILGHIAVEHDQWSYAEADKREFAMAATDEAPGLLLPGSKIRSDP